MFQKHVVKILLWKVHFVNLVSKFKRLGQEFVLFKFCFENPIPKIK